MVYKKNEATQLDDKLFACPTAEYRAAPFWGWNCKLDKDQLLRQIDRLKEMGFGGFYMHSRTGLDTEHLGDEFLQMVNACCDKAEQEQMLAWLYDEDRWPSGSAGGKVTKEPKFRRKRLAWFTQDQGWHLPKAEALEAGEPYLVGCYTLSLDEEGYLSSYERVSAEHPGDKWYVYVMNERESSWFNGQAYVDVMDEEAVSKFIESTYNRFYESIGERFGESVPAIFTDEPNVDHEGAVTIPTPEHRGRIKRGWSRFFEENYLKTYGEDIWDRLPERVWNKKDGSDSQIKYRYHDLKAEMFARNFCGQIGAWCRAHNIAFTGHLLTEPLLYSQAIASGESIRAYEEFDIPGIDMLCDFQEYTTAKQAQSAAHQFGKEGVMSELYGVTNWDFDFRGHKFQGDWQAALGVTFRVPHLTLLSMKGEAKRDYPASIGYQSPWYREYPYLEDHYARLNTALTRGQPIVNIGVIHPIESAWLLTGPNSQHKVQAMSLEEQFANVTRWLLETHLDFDFISEATVPHMRSQDARTFGRMRYDAIVVPGCLTLRNTTIAYLEDFRNNGGKVIFMGSCPTHCNGVKSDACNALFANSQQISFDAGQLATALQPNRKVSITNEGGSESPDYIYQYRQDGDAQWLFVAHGRRPGASLRTYGGTQFDVMLPDTVHVRVSGYVQPTEYDTMTGVSKPIAYRHEAGSTVITTQLDGYSSLLLKLEPANEQEAFIPKKPTYETVGKIPLRGFVRYECSEPNVLLMDQCRWALDDEPWNDTEELLRIDNLCRKRLNYPPQVGIVAQPYLTKPCPAEHMLRLLFTIESDVELSGVQLAVEDADKVALLLNGEPVEKTITGYFTDESIGTIPLPTIREGTNLLEIRLPYGPRTFVEWCYLLGDFGVKVMGTERLLTRPQEKLAFGNVCDQGLAHYGANVTYHIDVETEKDGCLRIRAPYYRGSLIGVSVDGERVGRIVLPPYTVQTENIPAGKHTVSLTLFGNRHNSFGPLHMVNSAVKWIGPYVWRTADDDWCYEYRLKPFGILKTPDITLVREV